MIVRIYGFDWENYTKRVMPAFRLWLAEGNETPIYQLYEQTRCSREETFLPPAMHRSRTWARAQAFIQQLPQSIQIRREYQLLCSAKAFTDLSDKYVHTHPPQLYPTPDALRPIWGALIEEYCRPWFVLPKNSTPEPFSLPEEHTEAHDTNCEEIISLLHAAGLGELAQEISALPFPPEDDPTDEKESTIAPSIEIGHHPTTLHLRGWLATVSVRSMALFELLACGRRSLPFGYRTGEPYEDYIGYLTPQEVWHFAHAMRHAQPPDPISAKADYARFRSPQLAATQDFRMLDEVLPAHADMLLNVVHMAAQYGLGLLCTI